MDSKTLDSVTDVLIGQNDSIVCPFNDLGEVLLMLVESGFKGKVLFNPQSEDCCSLTSVHCVIVVEQIANLSFCS